MQSLAPPHIAPDGIPRNDAAGGQHQQADDLRHVHGGPLEWVDVRHAAVAHQQHCHAGEGDGQVQPVQEH